jgi:hypothetical protein
VKLFELPISEIDILILIVGRHQEDHPEREAPESFGPEICEIGMSHSLTNESRKRSGTIRVY